MALWGKAMGNCRDQQQPATSITGQVEALAGEERSLTKLTRCKWKYRPEKKGKMAMLNQSSRTPAPKILPQRALPHLAPAHESTKPDQDPPPATRLVGKSSPPSLFSFHLLCNYQNQTSLQVSLAYIRRIATNDPHIIVTIQIHHSTS